MTFFSTGLNIFFIDPELSFIVPGPAKSVKKSLIVRSFLISTCGNICEKKSWISWLTIFVVGSFLPRYDLVILPTTLTWIGLINRPVPQVRSVFPPINITLSNWWCKIFPSQFLIVYSEYFWDNLEASASQIVSGCPIPFLSIISWSGFFLIFFLITITFSFLTPLGPTCIAICLFV